MSAAHISPLTVREWKQKGFTIEDATEGVNLSVVKSDGKPFYMFRVRYIDDVQKLRAALDVEVEAVADQALVAGQYRDSDPFPFYLVTKDDYDKLVQARDLYAQLHAALQKADRDFATVLLDPASYPDGFLNA